MIHTRLDTPLNLRKDLLEAAIDTAESLKNYDKLKDLEERRKIFSSKTFSLVKEFSQDIEELENFLPPLQRQQEEVKEELPKRVPTNPYRLTQKKKLESDIEEIRNRLASLGLNR